MVDFVNQFINHSPLVNPYEEGTAILKWAIAKHYQKSAVDGNRGRKVGDEGRKHSANLQKRRKVSREACVATNRCVVFYKDKGETTDFDNTIPEWHMPLEKLQTIYDKARFERYLNWKKQPYIGWRKYCFNRSFKRRIPWLHSEGK